MLGKHKFRVGMRVRLSRSGNFARLSPPKRRQASGIVTKVDQFNCPTVLWDYRKTTSPYHPDFIEPDRRRKPPAQKGG